MLIKNEVELHQESVEYIKETFSKYTEVPTLNDVIRNPIIHMYAKEDTFSEDGDLNGYIDALFCEIHVYDPINATVWKSKRLHDGILPFDELNVSQIKIFKDLSTLISLHGTYELSGTFQAFDVKKVN